MAIPSWESSQMVLEPTILGLTSAVVFNQGCYSQPPSVSDDIHLHGYNQNPYGYEYYNWYSHPYQVCAYQVDYNNPGFYFVQFGDGSVRTMTIDGLDNLLKSSYGNFELHSDSFGLASSETQAPKSNSPKKKRCAADGKKKAWRKKQKYELGRHGATSKLSSKKRIKRVSVRVRNGELEKFSLGKEILKKCQPLLEEGNGEIDTYLSDKIPQRTEISATEIQGDELLEIDDVNVGKAQPEHLSVSEDQLFDKSPLKDDTLLIDEEERKSVEDQLLDKSPQRAMKISHDVLVPDCNIWNDNSILTDNGEWERIYELICSDYEAQLVYTNGGGEELTQEDGEGSENRGQVFDKSLIVNGTILLVAKPVLVAERCKSNQEISLVDEIELFELFNVVHLAKPSSLELSMNEQLGILNRESNSTEDITALKLLFEGKLSFEEAFKRDIVVIIFDEPASGMNLYSMPLTWPMLKRKLSLLGLGDSFVHSYLQNLLEFNLTVRTIICYPDIWLVSSNSGLVNGWEKLPIVCANMKQFKKRKKYRDGQYILVYVGILLTVNSGRVVEAIVMPLSYCFHTDVFIYLKLEYMHFSMFLLNVQQWDQSGNLLYFLHIHIQREAGSIGFQFVKNELVPIIDSALVFYINSVIMLLLMNFFLLYMVCFGLHINGNDATFTKGMVETVVKDNKMKFLDIIMAWCQEEGIQHDQCSLEMRKKQYGIESSITHPVVALITSCTCFSTNQNQVGFIFGLVILPFSKEFWLAEVREYESVILPLLSWTFEKIELRKRPINWSCYISNVHQAATILSNAAVNVSFLISLVMMEDHKNFCEQEASQALLAMKCKVTGAIGYTSQEIALGLGLDETSKESDILIFDPGGRIFASLKNNEASATFVNKVTHWVQLDYH